MAEGIADAAATAAGAADIATITKTAKAENRERNKAGVGIFPDARLVS